jgi:8-oxo-dGTP diphosphatase
VLRRLHLALLKVYRRLPTAARVAYRNRWGFPGGLLERGEAPPAAARRESLEEVALDIEVVGEPAVVVDPGPRRVDIVFRARPADGADPDAVVPSSPEVVECRWFARDALPELQHEAAGALVALGRIEANTARRRAT